MSLTGPLKDFKKNSDLFTRSRFLKNMTIVERYEFMQLCHSRTYKKNEYIYYEGDPGTGMYFIKEGSVQLIVEPRNEAEGEPLTYDLESPENFGALSIGYELRRMSSAKCMTDCTLLGFFKPDFETLKKRHPLIAVKFIEMLAQISMQQLEIFTRRLSKECGLEQVFPLRFESYYNQPED